MKPLIVAVICFTLYNAGTDAACTAAQESLCERYTPSAFVYRDCSLLRNGRGYCNYKCDKDACQKLCESMPVNRLLNGNDPMAGQCIYDTRRQQVNCLCISS